MATTSMAALTPVQVVRRCERAEGAGQIAVKLQGVLHGRGWSPTSTLDRRAACPGSRDTPTTDKCGFRLWIFDVLAPCPPQMRPADVGNRARSPRSGARASSAATPTTTWRSTRRGQPRRAFRSAITSAWSWPLPTVSTSRPTSIATRTSPSCSTPGVDTGLDRRRAPRGPGKRGRLVHHPSEEGRLMHAYPSVPANRLSGRDGRSTRRGSRPLPPRTRHDAAVRWTAGGGSEHRVVGKHKGPRLNLWPDRRDPFMSNTQRVVTHVRSQRGYRA